MGGVCIAGSVLDYSGIHRFKKFMLVSHDDICISNFGSDVLFASL